MRPNDLPAKVGHFKHSRAQAESMGSDYLKGMSYFELSRKYGVSETTLRRNLTRIYGETLMPKKVRKIIKEIEPEQIRPTSNNNQDERIKELEAELRKKEKKIQQMEYQLDVLGDFLGKDFGLPKKK
jgi:lambda repressor-like predicted transcriptional regulator